MNSHVSDFTGAVQEQPLAQLNNVNKRHMRTTTSNPFYASFPDNPGKAPSSHDASEV